LIMSQLQFIPVGLIFVSSLTQEGRYSALQKVT
jgi:hypothetical protein